MAFTLARQFDLDEEAAAEHALGQLRTTVDALLEQHFLKGSRYVCKKRRNKANELELRVTHGAFMGELTFGVTVDLIIGQGGTKRLRVLHLASRQENAGAQKAEAARESMQTVGGVIGCAFIGPMIALGLGMAYFFLASGRSPGVAVLCLVVGAVFGLVLGRGLGRLMGGAETGHAENSAELDRAREAWQAFERDVQRTVLGAGLFVADAESGTAGVGDGAGSSEDADLGTNQAKLAEAIRLVATASTPEIEAEFRERDASTAYALSLANGGTAAAPASALPSDLPGPLPSALPSAASAIDVPGTAAPLLITGLAGQGMMERQVRFDLDDRPRADLLGKATRDLVLRLRDQHLPSGLQFLCESGSADPDRLQLDIRRGDFHGTLFAGLRRDSTYMEGRMKSHWVVGVEAEYLIESLQAADRVSRGVEDWFRFTGAAVVAVLAAVALFNGVGIGGSAGAVVILGAIVGGGWVGGKVGEAIGDTYSGFRERGAKADSSAAESVQLWSRFLQAVDSEFGVAVQARDRAGK